jgi:hypothetical protein
MYPELGNESRFVKLKMKWLTAGLLWESTRGVGRRFWTWHLVDTWYDIYYVEHHAVLSKCQTSVLKSFINVYILRRLHIGCILPWCTNNIWSMSKNAWAIFRILHQTSRIRKYVDSIDGCSTKQHQLANCDPCDLTPMKERGYLKCAVKHFKFVTTLHPDVLAFCNFVGLHAKESCQK